VGERVIGTTIHAALERLNPIHLGTRFIDRQVCGDAEAALLRHGDASATPVTAVHRRAEPAHAQPDVAESAAVDTSASVGPPPPPPSPPPPPPPPPPPTKSVWRGTSRMS